MCEFSIRQRRGIFTSSTGPNAYKMRYMNDESTYNIQNIHIGINAILNRTVVGTDDDKTIRTLTTLVFLNQAGRNLHILNQLHRLLTIVLVGLHMKCSRSSARTIRRSDSCSWEKWMKL